MNNLRLASRLRRMAKLLELNAPHTIILSEMRMVNDAFIDCEQHGYESDVTNNALRRNNEAEIDALDAAHEKHLDGKSDPECDLCELEDTIFDDLMKNEFDTECGRPRIVRPDDEHPDPERGPS